jgi:ribosomal protein S18 acetylase RimI-like enzyme
MQYKSIYGIPEDMLFTQIQELHQHVFDGSELLREELQNKSNLLTCLALHNDEVIGFKIGYELNSTKFYSWLGGVHNSYRQKGIASKLMNLQHLLLNKSNYKIVKQSQAQEKRIDFKYQTRF